MHNQINVTPEVTPPKTTSKKQLENSTIKQYTEPRRLHQFEKEPTLAGWLFFMSNYIDENIRAPYHPPTNINKGASAIMPLILCHVR